MARHSAVVAWGCPLLLHGPPAEWWHWNAAAATDIANVVVIGIGIGIGIGIDIVMVFTGHYFCH